MPVTVLYFAAARDAPGLAPVLARSRIAVDGEFAGDEAPLPDGAEVAIIPPVAGGAPLAAVVDRPLRLEEVVEAVSSTGLGGLVTFTGVVRDASHGRRVERLEYEAYAGMAERVLARIGEEVGALHGCR